MGSPATVHPTRPRPPKTEDGFAASVFRNLVSRATANQKTPFVALSGVCDSNASRTARGSSFDHPDQASTSRLILTAEKMTGSRVL